MELELGGCPQESRWSLEAWTDLKNLPWDVVPQRKKKIGKGVGVRSGFGTAAPAKRASAGCCTSGKKDVRHKG